VSFESVLAITKQTDLKINQGYIGGTALLRLLNHPEFASFNITVLVRSAQKAEKFKTFGINAVVGSYDDPDLVSSLASQNDIVIATVGCH
jgi:uncharacterized protein YbjT (DUF2867 family)